MKSIRARTLVLALAVTTATGAMAQDANYMGNIIGGVAGALLGSRIGGGNGNIAATAAGGIVGAMVGGNVQAGMHGRPQQQQQQAYQEPQAYETYREPERVQYQPQYQPQYEPQYQPQYHAQYEPQYESQYPSPHQPRREQVYTQSAPQAERSYGGSIVGGIAGALLGSRVGGGNGKIAATALGGVVGAVVGDRIQNAPVSQPVQLQRQPARVYYDNGPQRARHATPDGYAQPQYRRFTRQDQQDMDRAVAKLQRSRSAWVVAQSNLEAAEDNNVRSSRLLRLQTAEGAARMTFIADRDDFGRALSTLASQNYDVSSYANLTAAYSDVSMGSQITAAQAMNVQPVVRRQM